MTRRLFIIWLLLVWLAAASVWGQSVLILRSPSRFKDAIRDLKCVRYVATTASSYTEVTGHANATKINDWFDALYPSFPAYPDYNGLTFGAGYVCLADQIGIKDGALYTASDSGDLLMTATGGFGYFPDLAKVRISTTGTLPTGLTVETDYWVIFISATEFKLATSYADAVADTAIAYTDAGSGDHTVYQRTIPGSFTVASGGGWARGRNAPDYFFNVFSSGIIWVGDPIEPVLRLSGNGSIISLNVYYHRIIGSPEPTDRSKCAILMVQGPDSRAVPTGKHEISLNCEGFDAAVKVEGVHTGHGDATRYPRLETRNCLAMIDCDENQSVGHHVDYALFFCPGEFIQTSIFKFRLGGRFSADHLTVVGNYGTNVLDIGDEGGNDNAGSYKFGFVEVDRALVQTTAGNPQVFTASNSGGELLITYATDIPSLTNVRVRNTIGGELPGGLTEATDYWTVRVNSTSSKLATSLANAEAHITIDYTSAGSGTNVVGYPRGCFRLIKKTSNKSLWVRMAGHIAWSNEDLATNWLNLSNEPVVDATPPAGNEVHDIHLDVFGLDNATATAYPR